MVPPAPPLLQRDGREGLLLADDELLVLVRDVALDAVVVDQVGQDALGLVAVHVLHAHHLQRREERGHGDLSKRERKQSSVRSKSRERKRVAKGS